MSSICTRAFKINNFYVTGFLLARETYKLKKYTIMLEKSPVHFESLNKLLIATLRLIFIYINS